MASNHIEVTSSTRLGGEVRACVDGLQRVRDQIREVGACMAEFAGDDALLANYLGLSGESAAADAATVRGNFTNALSVLNGADINYFLNRMS